MCFRKLIEYRGPVTSLFRRKYFICFETDKIGIYERYRLSSKLNTQEVYCHLIILIWDVTNSYHYSNDKIECIKYGDVFTSVCKQNIKFRITAIPLTK